MLRLSAVEHGLLELAQAVQKTGYRFTTITPESHRLVNARPGNEQARDLAGIFGWSRPFDAAAIPRSLFDLMAAAEALVPDGSGWRSRYRFSSLDDLLLVHSAYPTQAADAVFFGPDSYRFVDAVRTALSAPGYSWRRVADIGCGTGAAGIALARLNPAAEIVMTDINPGALRLSTINAALAGTANVTLRAANLLDEVDGAFDLIVANPPYLFDAEKRLYRHGGGARGEGLSLAILDAALERLTPGGSLLLYTGVAVVDGIDPFREAAATRLAQLPHRWSYRELDPDVFGDELAHSDADRIAAVFLTLMKVS